MSLTTLQFAGFLLVVVTGFVLLPKRMGWLWLLAASLLFYALAEPVFLIQILAATWFAYAMGLLLERLADKQKRQGLLAVAIVVLLCNLAVFKYAAPLNDALRATLGLGGAGEGPIRLLMPLGISFYTFQLIGYLVDVFRGDPAERHLGIFTLFATLFTKVVSGPIERSRNLLPQLHALQGFSFSMAMAGAQLMAWGMFKKVVVADRLAPFVDRVYSAPQDFDGFSIAFATFLYAFQLYFDFSGYTDIALGAAMIMGIKLIPNFNRPYFAQSIQDFWKRWHISLTSWLTDYVYTPITRAKWIKIKLYNLILIALMFTFVVSGIWHGSYWTFVLWGALHGTYIVLSLLLQKPWNTFANAVGFTRFPNTYRAFKVARTFTLVCLAYVLFRAASLEDAFYMYSTLGTGWDQIPSAIERLSGDSTAELVLALCGIVVVMLPEYMSPKTMEAAVNVHMWRRASALYVTVLAVVLLGAFDGAGQQFIYFRF